MKSRWIEYLIQLSIVVFGVFLGMLATEWSSNKNQHAKQKDILISIKSELESNLEYVEYRIGYQKSFFNSLDSLTKLMEGKNEILNQSFHDEPMLERFPNWPGLGRPVMDNSMYDAAKYSDILPNLDIALIKQLSKTYHLQSNIDATRKLAGERLNAINSNTKYYEVFKFMWMVVQDYFGAHYELVKEYKVSIQMIDEYVAD